MILRAGSRALWFGITFREERATWPREKARRPAGSTRRAVLWPERLSQNAGRRPTWRKLVAKAADELAILVVRWD